MEANLFGDNFGECSWIWECPQCKSQNFEKDKPPYSDLVDDNERTVHCGHCNGYFIAKLWVPAD